MKGVPCLVTTRFGDSIGKAWLSNEVLNLLVNLSHRSTETKEPGYPTPREIKSRATAWGEPNYYQERFMDLTPQDLVWASAIRESLALNESRPESSDLGMVDLLKVGLYTQKGSKPLPAINQHGMMYAAAIGARLWHSLETTHKEVIAILDQLGFD